MYLINKDKLNVFECVYMEINDIFLLKRSTVKPVIACTELKYAHSIADLIYCHAFLHIRKSLIINLSIDFLVIWETTLEVL